MNREIDPDAEPRSALGQDEVIFTPPQRIQDRTSVTMNQPAYQPPAQPFRTSGPPQLAPRPNGDSPILDDKKYEFRTPSAAEQVKAFKELFYQINMARVITMNEAVIHECLRRIDGYVGYHSDGNGERTDKEIEQNINQGYWKFIVGDENKGRREVVVKPPAAPKKKKRRSPAKKITPKG